MIEIKNLRNCRPSEPYDVKVDRSSVLGNPFTGDRDSNCNKYAVYLTKRLADTDYGAIKIKAELARMVALYRQFGRLRLFCWCAPLRCHSEFIRAWLMNQVEYIPRKYYTGVGSRQTPENVLALMTLIADLLEQQGYVLRSGGAQGADTAFENGVKDQRNKQIYYAEQASPEAMQIASKYHPAWDRCSNYAKKLHGRNAFQVLGFDLDTRSEFLLCWTPDGCIQHSERSIRTGGTGTAISIAEAHGVHVVNLQHQDVYNSMKNWVSANLHKIRK